MGRPRTPTATLEQRGAFVKNPQRRKERAAEPVVTEPLGPPPPGLKNTRQVKALDCWREIVDALPPGVATKADRVTVEIVARLLAELRSPGGLGAAGIGALQRALASLGMTPADRSKVGVGKPRDDEPTGWDKLEGFGTA